MRLRKWTAQATGVAVIVLTVVTTAQGQVVTFSGITDAVPSRFFDAAATAPDPSNPNRLIIGLHTGMDWTTWKMRDFRASSGVYSYTTAMDTLNVWIEAPDGFYISKITYSQRGAGSVLRIGFAAGAGNWVIGGIGGNLGVFGSSPTLSRAIDLTGKNLTRVPVSITINLSAFATYALGSATLTLTGADLGVEVLPLTEAIEVLPANDK